MAKEQKNTKNRRRKSNIVSRMINGRMVSTNFFRRYRAWILLVMAFALTYIYIRYECMTSMENIQKLEKQLEVVNTLAIREKSLYMSNIRESSMNHLLKANGMNLKVTDRPPYKLKIKQ